MKLIIDIPEKTNAHIRSDYGHGMKCLFDEDREILCDAIYHGTPYEERPHGECNQCRYYDGVRGVPGHAPCWHWNIGGVMWNDYCSRFEEERER